MTGSRWQDEQNAATPLEADAHIVAAPNFADAQDRLEAALAAGVDPAALLAAQAEAQR